MRTIKLLVPILFIIALPTVSLSQQLGSWRPSTFSLGSGEDPLTSGIGIVAGFNKEGTRLISEVAFQNEQAWIAFGRSFGSDKGANGTIAGNIGHFQGAPWMGPRLTLDASLGAGLKFSLIEWPGYFLRKPLSYRDKRVGNMIGQYGGVSLSIPVSAVSISLNYGFQRFLGDPWNYLPGASVNLPLAKSFSAVATGTYNTSAKRPMFYIGSTWSVPKSGNQLVADK